ncbi:MULTISPECIES: glucokinase [Methylomicrobium]|uniref:Glucokinase n=1 Tax=Methylomicrobium album BG8 TaxID=686340 RepID=H8GJL6_METAL|nr:MULTISPECIES: glucokinase [Methylomicrobium]EIC30376.1 glucokinase [Methylomicrobium album BG8]
MILAGDVGGTKTILALFESEGKGWRCVKKIRYASLDHSTFTGLLQHFLADCDGRTIGSACLGVAGPIVDGDCVATNLPWVLLRREIGALAGTPNVRLLNDLEATAWGILDLPAADFVTLNAGGDAPPHGNRAVLAAGTGLGEAIIAWNGEAYQVLASEGGHTDFAPGSEQEIALLRYLWENYPGHVSYERLLSGEGLVNIYQFLKKTGHAPVQSGFEERMTESDPAAVIGEAGVAGTDQLSAAALSLFCRIYGAEAGNLALKCLPYAGIYLAGGIAPKILPLLTRGDFMEGYLEKGRYRTALKQIPVKVCINQEIGLLGALSFAARASVGS